MLGLDPERLAQAMREEQGILRIRRETTAAVRGGAATVPGLFAGPEVGAYLAAHGYEGPAPAPLPVGWHLG